MSIVFALERTNQLSLLPDKDLVDLCPPIEPYQVTKNPLNQLTYNSEMPPPLEINFYKL
ncbi:transposase [Microcystis panniformis FACHB-1757]|uniref:Transposase n=1 Tax=Microcystis panniformis FACHB-1757 TaxID=1638788 RepID=A0A0K1RVY4_9CHRO|nr:transposase [Microcystis panniformis FACHB-1757]